MCSYLKPTDAAYLAGLLDGEGSVVALKRLDGSVKSYRIHVSNTHLPAVEWCKAVTGLGRIDVYQRKGKPTYLPIGVWKVHGVKAASVLRRLLPYLKIKREKAQRAVEHLRP